MKAFCAVSPRLRHSRLRQPTEEGDINRPEYLRQELFYSLDQYEVINKRCFPGFSVQPRRLQ